MAITKLQFTEAGPFSNVTISFDPKVNVFVGANNTGKSTILAVLGEIGVYPFAMGNSYLRSEKSKWSATFRIGNKSERHRGTLPLVTTDTVAAYLKNLGFTMYVPALRYSTQFRSPGPRSGKSSNPNDPSSRSFETVESERLRSSTDLFKDHYSDDFPHRTEDLEKRAQLFSANTSLVSDEAVVQKIIELDYMAYRMNRKVIRRSIDKVASIVSEITEGFPLAFAGV